VLEEGNLQLGIRWGYIAQNNKYNIVQ